MLDSEKWRRAATSDAMSRPPGRGKRSARCDDCRLPLTRCLCFEVPRLEVTTRVVVVMHRNERLKSSNTGRLARRVLTGAQVIVRGMPGATDPPLIGGTRLVLFPGSHAEELAPLHGGPNVVLLVPDGSWSQARKLVQRDSIFTGATPVRLPETPPSRYLLRRHVRERTVCTFEAIAQAMGILENSTIEDEMLDVFDLFQARVLAARHPPVTSARRLRAQGVGVCE